VLYSVTLLDEMEKNS